MKELSDLVRLIEVIDTVHELIYYLIIQENKIDEPRLKLITS